jgi:hypothetical protein
MSRRPPVIADLAPILLLIALVAAPASAQRASADDSGGARRFDVALGLPPAPVEIHASSAPDGMRIELRGRGRAAHVTFSVDEGADVDVEVKTLASGAGVAIITVTSGERRFAALATARGGRPIVLFEGRLDLAGDPGERRGARIETADRTGDGAPDVIVGTVREDTAICGEPSPLLEPRAVHPTELTLVPVRLRRLPEATPDTEREVTPTTASPGPSGAPMVEALHFRRASSVAGLADRAPVPTGLGDGDLATAWVEGGGNGTWEFATATWAGGEGLPIRAFALVPRPSGPLAEQIRPPGAIWLVGDRGPRLRVPLPAEAAPGEVLWIVPPEPLVWRCVSVVLDAGPSPDGVSHVGLAELYAYSDVDFGGGIPHLVAELSAGGARADHAEALLGQLGRPAFDALGVAFVDMPPAERVRAVRAFARLAITIPEAREALGDAAIGRDADVAEAAREALFGLGDEGARTLASVAARDASGRALLELARRRPELAVSPLLDVMTASTGHAEGAARPSADEARRSRRALSLAVRSAPEPAAEPLEAFLASPRPPELLAFVAEALVEAGPSGRAFAERMIVSALDDGGGFEVRYRLARAAKALADASPEGLDERIRAFLLSEARSAEEWMMRAMALEALAAEGPAHDGLLASALADP